MEVAWRDSSFKVHEETGTVMRSLYKAHLDSDRKLLKGHVVLTE